MEQMLKMLGISCKIQYSGDMRQYMGVKIAGQTFDMSHAMGQRKGSEKVRIKGHLSRIWKQLFLAALTLAALCVSAMAVETKIQSAIVNMSDTHSPGTVHAKVETVGNILMAVSYSSDGRMKEVAIRDDLVDYAYRECVTIYLRDGVSQSDTVKVLLMDVDYQPIGSVTAEKVTYDRPTNRQKMAANARNNYFQTGGFSCDRIIEQLMFDGYSFRDAVYAADSYEQFWAVQAGVAAAVYGEYAGIETKNAMRSQLLWDGFPMNQVDFAVDWWWKEYKSP